jgi:UDP-N-acetylenolpyruvoylglucosamine reductase
MVAGSLLLGACGAVDDELSGNSGGSTGQRYGGGDKVSSGGNHGGGGEEAGSGLTSGQENALRTAEDYISMSGFSRSGLIEQLEFEGYRTKDAALAVDHLNVDWNKQAARSAEDYLSMSGFSRSGLIEQLEFEGYTRTQAEYGADKAL